MYFVPLLLEEFTSSCGVLNLFCPDKVCVKGVDDQHDDDGELLIPKILSLVELCMLEFMLFVWVV